MLLSRLWAAQPFAFPYTFYLNTIQSYLKSILPFDRKITYLTKIFR